ncbi:ABC transporter substrate-binding protein [Aeromicrobium sp. Leaf350]|uniref:ABC transporter substrate-binding protein n=1 Tax=Aeromicrobium sp. Leaf350 TaxID=2876565 RepID=UPI001E2D08EB|nr:ABC transporter substrate-binding protein [Aeromicrobium sp. Leaf350]
MKTRSIVGGIVGALLLLPLAACGSDSDSGDGDGNVDKTDGIDVELADGGPERIVAQSTVAAALTQLGLGDRIVGTFGPLNGPDGGVDSQANGLDPATVTDVTGAGDYGDIDEEKVAELDPDLVITSSYLEGDYWYMAKNIHDSLAKRYDIVAVSYVDLSLTDQIDAVEELAGELGADLESTEVTEGKAAFEAAAATATTLGEQLTAAGKTVVAVSGTTDSYYVSNPAVSADLNYWVETLGLPIVVPDNPDPQGYFETLSWEESDKYNADLALYDDRQGDAGLAGLKAQPVFATITAAQNDAFTPWTSVYPPTYQEAATLLTRFTTAAQGLL